MWGRNAETLSVRLAATHVRRRLRTRLLTLLGSVAAGAADGPGHTIEYPELQRLGRHSSPVIPQTCMATQRPAVPIGSGRDSPPRGAITRDEPRPVDQAPMWDATSR